MPLQTTGAISLSDVNVELGRSATNTINMNETVVRTLAGVATGAISMSDFYGKSAGPSTAIFAGGDDGSTCGKYSCSPQNRVTRINSSGTLIGSETNAGEFRSSHAGVGIGGNGLYYGGYDGINETSSCWRISTAGAQVGTTTNVGTTKGDFCNCGALVGGNAMFWSGIRVTQSVARLNTCTRISSTQTLVAAENSVATARSSSSGDECGGNGLWWAGITGTNTLVNTTVVINSSQAQVGSSTNVGTARWQTGAGKVGSVVVFWGGATTSAGAVTNQCIIMNSSATQVGSTTNVDTGRRNGGGTGFGDFAMFYGGVTPPSFSNRCTRINSSGVQVGTTTTLGTARTAPDGAAV